MPVLNRAAEMAEEITGWRRQLHEIPELLYDVHETAAFVAAKLGEFGCDEVVTGIGKTGVVGLIRGKGDGPVIGLRSDMDALPINEATGVDYASRTPGKMHACGHDGHMAMLLGAAKYLAETRNFNGSVAVIFQPAEEGGAGGKAMVDDGMMDRFNISSVYGMHNMPGVPVGSFAIRPGPIMAATDQFDVTVHGHGGHAAQPHRNVDPVVISSQIISSLQTIVSRNANPLDSLVVSVTKIHAGDAYNVIPAKVEFAGTIRTLTPEMRELAEKRFRETVTGLASALGGKAEVKYHRGYPATINHEAETEFAARIAADVAGAGRVDTAAAPVMGGEDFSFMLLERPGAFIFMGNGDTANLHNPHYDFADEAIPHGVSYWVRLVETALAA